MKKTITFILVLAMALSLSVTAFAEEDSDNWVESEMPLEEKEVISTDIVDINDLLIMQDDVWINIVDEDNYATDAFEPDPYAPVTRANNQLFSMYANVKESVTTFQTLNQSAKCFTKDDLSYGYLDISGTGTYSDGSNSTFEVGAGFYNTSTHKVDKTGLPVCEFTAGVYQYEFISADSYKDGVTYYGFVRNTHQNDTTLTGTFYFYNTSK